MDLGPPVDVHAVREARAGDVEVLDLAVALDDVGERSVEPDPGDAREVAASVGDREHAAVERVRRGVHRLRLVGREAPRAPLGRDEREVVVIAAVAVRRHNGSPVGQHRRAEPRAVVTEERLWLATAGRDRVQVEVPLVPEIRERDDRSAVAAPVDEMVDAVRARGERPGAAPVRVHDPDRPALVAALVGAVGDPRPVGRHPVRTHAVALVAEPQRGPVP